MLQEFPAETPVVPIRKKPAELQGFYPEAARLVQPALASSEAYEQLPGARSDPRASSKFIGAVAAIAVVLAAVGIAPTWRPATEAPSIVVNEAVAGPAVRDPAEAGVREETEPPRVDPSQVPAPRSPAVVARERPEPSRRELPERVSLSVTRQPRVVPPRTDVRTSTSGSARPTAPAAAATTVERSSPSPAETGAVAETIALPSAVAVNEIAVRADAVPTAIVAMDEEDAIRNVISRYKSAYENLDATAAKQVWPSVDERALARAFAGLQSQTLNLRPCQIDVTGSGARALCRGSAKYVGRVGNRLSSVQPREWRFGLRKTNGGWQIDSVRTQEADYGSNE